MRSAVPLHHQIAQVLRQRVLLDAGGAELPTETQLCQEFGVSRTTVRQALQQLKSEGLVHSRRGVGTRGAARMPGKVLVRGMGDPLHGELSGRPVIVRVTSVPAPVQAAAFLGLQPGDPVFCAVRTHALGGEPLSVVYSYLALAHGRGMTRTLLRERTMHQLLFELHGITQKRSTHRVRVARADREVAALLSIGLADPVLNIQSSVVAADGTPLRFTENFFREDRYEYTAEMDWAKPTGRRRRPGNI
jgi:GntR family transcriptional regulator